MKSGLFKVSTLCISLSLAACSGFLDEVPLSTITDKNYYKTASDAEGAVNAIYEAVGIGSVGFWFGMGNGNTPYGGLFSNDYWLSQELMSDNAIHDDWRYSGFDTFSLSETDGQVKTLWFNFYRAINTANVAIARIPSIDMDADRRDHLVAEARFWRGLCYTEMVKLWGDVPLCLTPCESIDPLFDVERADKVTALDACLADFEFAIAELLPGYREGYGRADKMIATAVAAKAALIKAFRTGAEEDYQAAADYANTVILSERFDLYPNFGDNFVIAREHGMESVLSINYGLSDTWKSQFNVSLLPSEIRKNSPMGNEGPDNANSWISPSRDLYTSYAEGDTRRDATIMSDFTYSDGSVYVFDGNAKYPFYYTKYWDRAAEPDGKNSDQNYPYMRFSEVLLIYAEALNEVYRGPTPEAYTAINRVRDRAFQDNGSGAHDLEGLDYAGFRKAMLDERRWELALEGSRWFDLVRLATDFPATVNRVKPDAYPEQKHKLFPVPQYERLLNDKITQNDGY